MAKKIYYVCPHCLEAYRSHGEQFNVLVNPECEDLEEHTTCDFCDDDFDEYELTPITF